MKLGKYIGGVLKKQRFFIYDTESEEIAFTPLPDTISDQINTEISKTKIGFFTTKNKLHSLLHSTNQKVFISNTGRNAVIMSGKLNFFLCIYLFRTKNGNFNSHKLNFKGENRAIL